MSNPIGLVAVSHATYGGVYYTANFTMSGAITWSRLTTTGLTNLLIDWFNVDPFDPYNRQYVLLNNRDILTRNGGNWSKIMDKATALALSGDTILINDDASGIWSDPTVQGRIYFVYKCDEHYYLFRSNDYGANWSIIWNMDPCALIVTAEVKAFGNNIWLSRVGDWPNKGYSSNGGTSFTETQPDDYFLTSDAIAVDPNVPTVAYGCKSGGSQALTKLTGGSPIILTDLQDAIGGGLTYRPADRMWFDPDDALHMRLGSAVNTKLFYTHDGWATYTTIDTSETTSPGYVTALQNSPTHDEIIFGKTGGPQVYVLANEADTTADTRNGANLATPPYTGAIPDVVAIAYYGIWVGYLPAGKGVYVYSDEQGEITDVPTYSGLGIPMFGSDASFRDLDADTDGLSTPTVLAKYHAQDIHAETPQRHNPWPAAAGEAPVSDGTKYVATDIATQAELNTHAGLPTHHAAVTLDADAAILLDLNVQEIGLDTQTANTVFAGPATGAANEPTFRALVIADLPITTHEHIINEDHTAQCDGSEDTFTTLVDFRITSTQVYLNGLRQLNGVDYSEAAALDSVVFITPPEAGDTLIIDYICSYADYLTTDYLLYDSDNIRLLDSDGEFIVDSE